jgi:hypothetical protein
MSFFPNYKSEAGESKGNFARRLAAARRAGLGPLRPLGFSERETMNQTLLVDSSFRAR